MPATAILVVSLLSLIALVITLDTVANMISFGALFAFSAVNLAVVKHYLVDQKPRGGRNYLLYGAIPGLGFLSTLWLWSSLTSLSFTIGLCWMGMGLVVLMGLTRAFRVKLPELQMAGDATRWVITGRYHPIRINHYSAPVRPYSPSATTVIANGKRNVHRTSPEPYRRPTQRQR